MQNSNNKSMVSDKRYYSYIEDTNDGTGDGILTIPDEIVEEMGWKEGTVLKMVVEETPSGNVLILTESVADKQQDA